MRVNLHVRDRLSAQERTSLAGVSSHTNHVDPFSPGLSRVTSLAHDHPWSGHQIVRRCRLTSQRTRPPPWRLDRAWSTTLEMRALRPGRRGLSNHPHCARDCRSVVLLAVQALSAGAAEHALAERLGRLRAFARRSGRFAGPSDVGSEVGSARRVRERWVWMHRCRFPFRRTCGASTIEPFGNIESDASCVVRLGQGATCKGVNPLRRPALCRPPPPLRTRGRHPPPGPGTKQPNRPEHTGQPATRRRRPAPSRPAPPEYGRQRAGVLRRRDTPAM